jgi:hypothetical protein
MNNETYLDFCFVRKTQGNFSKEINDLFLALFAGINLNWFLEEKVEQGADIVIAQVKGMSKWRSEEETIQFLEDQAGETFWEYLQGYQMYIYPANTRGCSSCETH